MTSEKRTYECEVKLVCKTCGRELNTDGHYVDHRSGTVSFIVYNADKTCYWCKMEKERSS
jgi:hypothetical protein